MTHSTPSPELAPASEPVSDMTTPQASVLKMSFPGTGREYFGIWIVNLLLIVVTLGLYYPWARARRLQFFAGSTDVGGYRLAFTGVARQMFLGFAIAVVAFLVYSMADSISPILSPIVIVLFGLFWPLVMRAALRFRLAKTRWRGLPFTFTGSTADAYLSFLPAIVLVVLSMLLLVPGFAFAAPVELTALSIFGLIVPLALLLGVGVIPWLHFRVKRYQQANYRYANRQSTFSASTGSFYLVYLKTALVALVAVVLVHGVTMLAGGLSIIMTAFDGDFGSFDTESIDPFMAGLAIAVYLLGAFLGWQATSTFFTTRIHNLVWSNTNGKDFAFAAELKFWPFLRLRLFNMFMKIITLGLYIPFAQVAIARIKLESMALAVSLDLDALIDQAQRDNVSAGADAAADIFDMDIGM